MTALRSEPMHESGLRILAEVPTYVSRRVAKHRNNAGDASAETVAERVVAELNEGQRWALAVATVTAQVAAYDRAHVRQVEKQATKRKAKLIDFGRPMTPELAEQVRARAGDLRELAFRRSANLFLEINQELVDCKISLGDGTKVKIGDATLAQLEQRAAWIERQANGNIDTLARILMLIGWLQNHPEAKTIRETIS